MRLSSMALTFLALCFASASPSNFVIVKRQDCQPSYSSCAPVGATASSLPPVGTALAPLYDKLLNAAKSAPTSVPTSAPSKRDALVAAPVAKRDAPGMCCAEGSACLNIDSFDVPMCYVSHASRNTLRLMFAH